MSTQDQDRLANHVQSIVDTIENGCFSKDELEVLRDNQEIDSTWRIWNGETNDILDDKVFATKEEAQEYIDNHQGIEVSGFDYLSDVLDINYILNSDKTYKAAKVLVAFGGPNIWINTEKQQVEGYWWGSQSIIPYNKDAIGLDETLNDIFNC